MVLGQMVSRAAECGRVNREQAAAQYCSAACSGGDGPGARRREDSAPQRKTNPARCHLREESETKSQLLETERKGGCGGWGPGQGGRWVGGHEL